jgi:DnaK suppressor protein
MTQLEKNQLKLLIDKEIQALTLKVNKLQSELKPIKKDCSLDSIDHKILKQDQNITIQRYETMLKRLNRLKATYPKIDTSLYGICKECDEDINIERLKLIPESEYCVACMNELGV